MAWPYEFAELDGSVVAAIVGREDQAPFVARCDAALSFVVGPLIRATVGPDFDSRMANDDVAAGGIRSVAITATLRVAQQDMDGAQYFTVDGGYSVRHDAVEPSFTVSEQRVLDLARKRLYP
jgi:hypothetical protein